MDNMFRGELVTRDDFFNRFDKEINIIKSDLLKPLDYRVVIDAFDSLITKIDKDKIISQLSESGLPKWAIKDYIDQALKSISKEELTLKVERELGPNPFVWKKVTESIEVKEHPLGVMMHIGAGNALGLSAISVMEGMLTGNINILKLPSHEGGISLDILKTLVEVEPRLKPFIYVVNVSSSDEEMINKLIKEVDAVLVWGGDETVQAIRRLTPPTIKLIEWGHRLSFSYFTKQDDYESDLRLLANDIVSTDQLYCSSPQCVFLETESFDEVESFSKQLFEAIKVKSKQFPPNPISLDVQSQITWVKELVKTEEAIGEKKLFVDETNQYSVLLDYKASLKPSPLFRNIWVMPVKRVEMMDLLRNEKGHLQTVGLSTEENEFDSVSNLFYAAGVNRVMPCGEMSSVYSGEAHDGDFALSRYVRVITRKK